MSNLAQSFRDMEVYQESFRLQQEKVRLTEHATIVGRLLGSTIKNYESFCSR
jgi:hypothetical protein